MILTNGALLYRLAVCALRETMTAPKPSRFGRCCITALRTRTCSSCACGYLGKIEIKKQVALYFLISIAMFSKEELNIKMLSHSVAHNRVDRCKKSRGRRDPRVTPSFDANSSLLLLILGFRGFSV